MKNKVYTFILLILCCGWWPARAQDTTAGCNAQFSASVSGNSVSFRAADSIAGVQHSWNFGDTSQLGYGPYPVVSHTYSHSGVYRVTHLVRDSAIGCFDSSSQLVTIGALPPQCSITFTYSHDSTRPGQPYYFYAQPNLAGATSDSVTWRVNDTIAGTGDTLVRILPNGASNVCANLVTSSGCQSQYCQTINAGDTTTPPPPPTCSVNVTYSHDSTQPNQPYYFFAQPSLAGATSDSVSWRVNDTIVGMSDTLVRVLHNGMNTICANLVTNLGCQSQACVAIMVGDTTTTPPPPPACSISFTYSHDSTLADQPYIFTAYPSIDSATSDSITWTVNGTTVGAGTSLTRNFTAGTYTVCAALVTNLGCTSTACQTIVVTDSTATPPDTAGQFIRCFPNPAYSWTDVILLLKDPAMIYVRVYNSMGGEVEEKTVSGFRGTNIVNVPLGSLQQGIYYIQLQYGNELKRSRIQKL
ncbi:MAG TPA: PKD domain-containing protein [Puia sp.]|nr:PKD domain-containing protein [Puia sp.]